MKKSLILTILLAAIASFGLAAQNITAPKKTEPAKKEQKTDPTAPEMEKGEKGRNNGEARSERKGDNGKHKGHQKNADKGKGKKKGHKKHHGHDDAEGRPDGDNDKDKSMKPGKTEPKKGEGGRKPGKNNNTEAIPNPNQKGRQ